MKVVIFCGGQGMRIREYSDKIPKPLIPIGNETPILINIMKYYAHLGHKEFILCLGYKSEIIKDYFVNYKEYKSNDFTLKGNTGKIELFKSDLDNWKITFVDTGINSNIGTRLQLVKPLINDDIFMATYGDCLTDINMNSLIEKFKKEDAVASFLAARPFQTYHIVKIGNDGKITGITPMRTSDLWVNGGFFIMKKQIFDYINATEELVEEPFQRLLNEKKLIAFPYEGFWASVDTFKDKQVLDDMYTSGDTLWEIWKKRGK